MKLKDNVIDIILDNLLVAREMFLMLIPECGKEDYC